MAKIAVDFGTTNTVVAIWRDDRSKVETVQLPDLSSPPDRYSPSLIPSLVYVVNGKSGDVLSGYAVHVGGYSQRANERFFSSFKRGIAALPTPMARIVDGVQWDESKVGASFLKSVMKSVSKELADPIDEIVASVPVQSFERYLKWLRTDVFASGDFFTGSARLRVVDESTSAALGYDVRVP